MVILAFDTCFDACSVCVARVQEGGVEVQASASERFATGHAERLVPMIAEVMERAGATLENRDCIAVTTGPGTFTGTRIGVAAARGFALATGCKIVSATSLAVMARIAAERLEEPGSAGELAIAMDARRGEVYVQLFSADGREIKSPVLLRSVEDAAGMGNGGAIAFAGSGAAAVAEVAQKAGRHAAAHLPELLPDATALALMAMSLPPVEGALTPFYLRPPDAKPQSAKTIARA